MLPAAGEEIWGKFAVRSWDFAEFRCEFQYEWDHQPPEIGDAVANWPEKASDCVALTSGMFL